MSDLSTISRTFFYALMSFMGVYTVLVLLWQINILRGKEMKNPDGTVDSWREQKIFYCALYSMLRNELFCISYLCDLASLREMKYSSW